MEDAGQSKAMAAAVMSSCDCDDAAVDWRGRPCRPRHHGGMRAAAFALGMVALEMAAVAAVGNNLITYVFGEMHFPLAEAANVVTNFVGAVFLLALLGGFLADSYLGCFPTILAFSLVELAGLVLLSLQARLPRLRPPPCDMASAACEKAGGIQAAVFFAALYMVALGSGCLKPNMIAHGADQLAGGAGARAVSTYFNAAYFCFCAGELVALTALVWVQTHSGMGVGFGVSAGAMAGALACVASGAPLYRNKPPRGCIFTPIARVFVAAFTKRKLIRHSSSSNNLAGDGGFRHADKFRFLDKACVRAARRSDGGGDAPSPESPWELCTEADVRQAKTLLAVAPIFACTIVFNTVLAQLQTFSVQQGAAMDTALPGFGFRMPPASLQAIPYAVMLVLVPAYELLLTPLSRRLLGRDAGAVTPLRRVGVGLFTVAFSMVAAAAVERRRRRRAAAPGGERMSVLWIAPQFLVFGVSEMFTAVGLVEFLYEQAAAGTRAFMTALTYCSYALGFFLSSALVSLVNSATAGRAGAGAGGWLGDNDLDKDRLDLFYWTLAALSAANFCCFLLCARWYSSGAAAAAAAARSAAAAQVAAEGNAVEIIT
ncbi:protein NRT1/ PTR FAMILY 4.4-like [Oryza brachyantha]|uniref:protein NRT1/ PTR FAMILY 4.4-like n=1 Tax=Oryza brachyantha TaxID=4533 RepID=UPI001ADA6ABB|nr:protein NRT1/ PTR FAMILY 4.4-like [Oryza brachyantha]